MSSALHHGPPGSFKTFTLVQRRAIDALAAGRVVVSNIRGFENFERVVAAFPEIDFSNSAQLIYLDTESTHNRKLMALWYLWVPFGAVVLIDEVQRIYRAKDKVQDLTAQAYSDIYRDELVNGRQRPDNFYDAFDMQRHFNWDIFMSSTNIAKVRSEIREVCEWAYRHRNVSGLLPWKKDSWYEHQHDPEQSGKIASHRVGVPIEYRADPRVFACYESTATGDHLKSTAGRSIFSDPKIMGTFGASIVLILISISLAVYQSSKNPIIKSEPIPSKSVNKTVSKPVGQGVTKNSSNTVNNANPVIPVKELVVNSPLADKKIVISGHAIAAGQERYLLDIYSADGSYFKDDTNTLLKLGYSIYRVSDCMFYYVYQKEKRLAVCAENGIKV